MKKFNHLLLVLIALLLSNTAIATETRYISDDLIAYMHKGPSDKFLITGSILAGSEVTLLEVSQATKYARIRDEKGRTGWILMNQLNMEPSLRTKVPLLEKQVIELTTKLATINDDWNKKTSDMQNKVANSDATLNALKQKSDSIIESLKQQNEQLTAELNNANTKIDGITVQLDDKQRDIIQQWFTYGGGVAGGGLILGLLLPYLIPRRKDRNRWMN